MGSAFCKSLFHCVRGLACPGKRSALRVDFCVEADGFFEEDREGGLTDEGGLSEVGRGGRETDEGSPSLDFCEFDLALFLDTKGDESTFIGE